MSIYPTLCDLAGIATPSHAEGKSIRSLLANPKSEWTQPAMTTYLFGNHAIRSEGWRYIRYNNGDEELYNEANDPNEWKNLAKDPNSREKIEELARFLPKINHPDVGGGKGKKEGEADDARKAEKRKMRKAAKNAAPEAK